MQTYVEPSGTEGVDVVFDELVEGKFRVHEDAHKAGVFFAVLAKRADVGSQAFRVETGGHSVHKLVYRDVAVAALHYDGRAEGFAQRVEERVNKVVQVSHRVGIGRIVNPVRRGSEGVSQFVKREVLHRGQKDVRVKNIKPTASSFA